MPLNNRIIGGITADKPIPWQVQVRKYRNSEVYCGGTIIDRYTILSAAHCQIKRDQFIVAGVVGISDVRQMRRIKKVIRHPEFNNPNPNNQPANNDICIVKLYQPLKFRENTIGNACLPPSSSFAPPSRAVVSGWGFTKYGMYRKVASISMYTPIYSHSLEGKKVQAFCLLQIFLSDIRTT